MFCWTKVKVPVIPGYGKGDMGINFVCFEIKRPSQQYGVGINDYSKTEQQLKVFFKSFL